MNVSGCSTSAGGRRVPGAFRSFVAVACTCFVMLAGWVSAPVETSAAEEASPSDGLAPASATPTTARLCPAGEQCFSYAKPRVMKKRFKNDRYGNAAGTTMPRWVFRKAKRYVLNHPGAAPASVRPSIEAAGRSARGLDWGWLEWTKDRLNNVRCLSLDASPVTWFGCDGQPDWINTVRRVKVKCGGAALIIAGVTRNPIAVGSGVGVCLWNEIVD